MNNDFDNLKGNMLTLRTRRKRLSTNLHELSRITVLVEERLGYLWIGNPRRV